MVDFNPPKPFKEKQLNKSKGILDDYAVRKNIASREGSITRTPTEDIDIANKKYVDDEIAANTSAKHTQNTDTALGSGAVAAGHGTASTDQIINVCYGTGSPPAASTVTEGTIFLKHDTAADTRYEYWHDAGVWYYLTAYQNIWYAQTFTVGSAGANVNHTPSHVKLFLHRYGLPGTITVAIKAVDGNNKPTGADLATGTYDGDTISDEAGEWITIPLTAYELQASTQYAVILKALDGDWNKAISWGISYGSGAYGGGNECITEDGTNWDIYDGYDFLFEFGKTGEGTKNNRIKIGVWQDLAVQEHTHSGGGGSLSQDNYTGANCTGSDGAKNRTLESESCSMVFVGGLFLHLNIDYTYVGTTITFLNNLWNDQPITIFKGLGTNNYLGADTTGSNGDVNRTLDVLRIPLMTFVNNSFLHLNTDYTLTGTTITFLNKLWDDQSISIY